MIGVRRSRTSSTPSIVVWGQPGHPLCVAPKSRVHTELRWSDALTVMGNLQVLETDFSGPAVLSPALHFAGVLF